MQGVPRLPGEVVEVADFEGEWGGEMGEGEGRGEWDKQDGRRLVSGDGEGASCGERSIG